MSLVYYTLDSDTRRILRRLSEEAVSHNLNVTSPDRVMQFDIAVSKNGRNGNV